MTRLPVMQQNMKGNRLKTRVAILGGTGYTALELLRILLRHPHAEITAVTSRSETGHVGEVHPSLHGRLNLRLENLSAEQLRQRADVVFGCLPHVASMETVPSLLSAGLRVIDLSADYRLNDAAVYEKWYGHAHSDVARLASTVYGLPELFASQIPGQQLIANPGCYTSTSILALAPLLAAKLIEPTGIIIDAKSGVSGAGRTPKLNTPCSAKPTRTCRPIPSETTGTPPRSSRCCPPRQARRSK